MTADAFRSHQCTNSHFGKHVCFSRQILQTLANSYVIVKQNHFIELLTYRRKTQRH